MSFASPARFILMQPLCQFGCSLLALRTTRGKEPHRQPVLFDLVLHIVGVFTFVQAFAKIGMFGGILGELAPENRVIGCDVHPALALVVEDDGFFLVFGHGVWHGGTPFFEMGIKKATSTEMQIAKAGSAQEGRFVSINILLIIYIYTICQICIID